MEHVIKLYFRFLGGFIHREKFFLNSLFNPSSAHFDSLKFNPGLPAFEKPTAYIPVGFFLLYINQNKQCIK